MHRRSGRQSLVFGPLHSPAESICLESWKTRELETTFSLVGELGLQESDDAVVAHWLLFFGADVGVDQAFNRNHVASDNTGVLQQLLCLLVEALASSDDGVRDCQKDDLDELDTDDLRLLAHIQIKRKGGSHRSRSRSAGPRPYRTAGLEA
jgi:hypothetical protein